jgi:hypothetical protein
MTNFPNDQIAAYRGDRSYDDESKTLQLSTDAPFAFLDAYLDRLSCRVRTRPVQLKAPSASSGWTGPGSDRRQHGR